MTPERTATLSCVADVSETLSAAYATVASGGGIAVYGTAESLRRLASCIRSAGVAGLPPPPAEVIEAESLQAMRVVSAHGSVELRVVGQAIEVVGDSDSRAKLAASVESLAADDPFGGVVARHIDVEYFPGHGFLAENSAWMTVTLLATPEA
jgi:hypothetical protein